MLKISEEKKDKRSMTLRLEGRVTGPWAGELLQVADLLLAGDTNLALDLTEVSFADDGGVAVLTSLNRRGVALVRPSPFVAEQLKSSR